jgi:hypothetical protein
MSDGSKRRCLSRFINATSMSNLQQDTCSVCNCTSYSKDMKRMKIREVSNQALLVPHADLNHVIPVDQSTSFQRLTTDTPATTLGSSEFTLC